MTTDALQHPLRAGSLRRIVLALAFAGLALLTALWSVTPPAAASSHLCINVANSDAENRDCRTLLTLKGELDPNNRLTSWYEDNAMVNWEGIHSSAEDGVSTLEIYGSMRGDQNPLMLSNPNDAIVPAGLGSLPNLRFLRMWKLGLTGSIPAELGNLSNLEELRLDQNNLTGSIPAALGNLDELRYLSLTLNQLSGGIPSALGNLDNIEYLGLDRNFLGLQTHPTAGESKPGTVNNPIPSSLGNLSTLKGLALGSNNFSGSIPSALGNLSNLDSLYLEDNDFTGSIPGALGRLTKLEILSAHYNRLSGGIPSALQTLTLLEDLSLERNFLGLSTHPTASNPSPSSVRNPIPTQLGRLSNLEELRLNENRLSGSIPSQLGDLTKLRRLYLDTNQLSGSIPAALGDLTNLIDLGLSINQLSGAIPAELANLTNLQDLNLDDNALSGTIPSELGAEEGVTKALDYINLSCNLLEGDIPVEFAGLRPPLRVLLLSGNNLNAPTGEALASLNEIPVFYYRTELHCPRGQPDAAPPSNDDVPPKFEEAELSRDGLTIVLTYDESLDSSNEPPTTAFTVKVDGQAVTVSTVTVRIREVRLDLGGAVTEHQSVTVAYEDPTSGDDEDAIQDRSGNDAKHLEEMEVTGESAVSDGIAPGFDSSAMSTDGTTITLTYTEVLDSQAGPVATDFAVVVEGEPRTVSRVSVSDRQVNLHLEIPITVRQSVFVSYYDPTSGNDLKAIQDRSGNDADDLIDHEVTNVSEARDERPPGFKQAVMSSDGLSITLLFDEVLDDEAGPTAADFSVEVDGEVVDLSTSSPVTVSGRTVVLKLANAVLVRRAVTMTYTDPTGGDDTNAIQDAAGNDTDDLINKEVANNSRVPDNVDPYIMDAKTPDQGNNAGAGDRIQLIYSEVLDHKGGPAGTDFAVKVDKQTVSLAGGNPVTVSGATVELRLANAVRQGQSITVSYYDPTSGNDPKAIQDRVGRDAATVLDYPVDNNSSVADGTPPDLLHAELPAAGDRVILTFDEFLQSTYGPATTDFTVAVDKDTAVEQTRTVTSVTISDATVVLYLNSDVLERRDVTVTYTKPADDPAVTNPAIQDRVGNDATGFTHHLVTNNSRDEDFGTPYITDAKTPDEGEHDGAGDRIWVIYSEVLDDEDGPADTDFVVKVDKQSVPLAASDPVTVSGATVELRLASAVRELQEITVSYYDPTSGNDVKAIQDRVGRDADTREDYTVENNSEVEDNTAPGLDRAEMPRASDRVVLTFNEVLDSDSGPAGPDFEIKVDGQAVQLAQNSPVTVSDRTVEVLLASAVAEDKAVTITYNDPTTGDDANAIQDRKGKDAATFTDRLVTRLSGVVDNMPPSFVSAKTPDNGDGDRIILTFTEDLDSANGPANDDFLVKVAGEERTTEEQVVISGVTIELSLTSDVTMKQPISVTYSDPTSRNDAKAIQDPSGNDANSFSNRGVSNESTQTEQVAPFFVSAEMPKEGVQIILTFSEPLDTEYPPSADQFTVAVDKGTTAEEARSVENDVIVTGRTVVLNLDATVREKRSVVVSYEDLTTGPDLVAIQDYGGNDSASFADKVVTNNSRVRDDMAPKLHPTLENAKTPDNGDGDRIILIFDEVLDTANGPGAGDFVVRVAGEERSIDNQIIMNGATIELTLQSVVTVNQEISVTYTDPTSGNDTKAIQDRAGNDTETFTADVRNNSTQTESIAPTFKGAATSEDGSRVILTFSEALDSANGPSDQDFVVKVEGQERAIESNVDVSGRTVVLTLSTPVTQGDVITVSYTDPTNGDDFNAIQDHGGNDAGSFEDQTVTNNVARPPTRPPSRPSPPPTPSTPTPSTPQYSLDVSLVMPEGAIQVGQTLTYTVTIHNNGTDSLTGLSWRDVTSGTAAQSLSDLAAGASVSVTGNFGPMQASHVPSIVLTVAADSDQTEEALTSRVVQVVAATEETTTQPPPSSGSSGQSSTPSTPQTPQYSLGVSLTVPEGAIQVGQTLTYTVTVSNNSTDPLTGLSWRDVTSGTSAQSLSNLAAGSSTAATGSFGPLQSDHAPHIILTVAADSDQTDEVVTSKTVQVVAAPEESTTPQPPASDGLSGQPPTGVRPKVPSSLVLRVVRVKFNVPDVHLAHNIPDLLLTLPDGSETTCNFLTHYENTGGLTRWGHATSEVLEERPGSLTQYYQRGVVDCHAREGDWLMERRLAWDHFGGGVDGSEDLGVEPHLLSEQPGELLGPWGHRASNYAVDGTYIGFLDFFTALGGVPAFGYPKSEARFDNDPRRQLGIAVATQGFVRQYFQAAVMEYHPNTLSTVMLRLLGDDLRNRRYPNESYKAYASFGSAPPVRVGQIYVAELVAASPGAAPALAPAVVGTPLPGAPAKPSTLKLRVDRLLYSEPDVHMGHNVPDLTLLLPDGSESTCNFLTYFESNHGLSRWGHPTSEVLEERDAVLSQYFQRGVLDCEERDGEWSVSRRLAWDYVGGGAAGAPDLGVEANLVSEQLGELLGPWGHRVSNYAVDGTYTGFLDFFSALGGAATFGFPKTEARYDDHQQAELSVLGAARHIVRQYFQSAVLEYHPGDTFQPVKLRLLGDDVRDRLYPNQTYKAYGSFGPSIPLAKGQFYTPERITPPGVARISVTAPPAPPSATRPFVTPRAPSTLGLRVDRVLFSAPDVHLAHNIPDLTLTLADGSEATCGFLSFYESTYGVARWGHAISEVLEERPGSLTQYFQRGVLDCNEGDGEWRVVPRLAWDHIGGGINGAPDLGVEPELLSDQAGELLGPWGHRVSNYAVDGTFIGFLDFFTGLGGEATFGLPKTEARYDDDPRAVLRVPNGDPGVIRQYFQAAVLEYHPNDAAEPVKLYLLGDNLRDWRYPSYGVFVSFGSFGPLSEGQPYYPVSTLSVQRPSG